MLLYKYFGGYSGKDSPVPNIEILNESKTTNLSKKDTFSLKPYVRDPFLGTITRKVSSKIFKNKNKFIPKKIKKIVVETWPKLEYLGFIKELNSEDPLLLIKINGRLKRKNASYKFVEGIKVLNFYKDSILIQFNSENKMIKKYFLTEN